MSGTTARDGVGAGATGTHVERLHESASLQEGCSQLMRALEARAAAQGGSLQSGRSHYLRLEQPVAGAVDPVAWLQMMATLPRFYWEGADSGVAFAAAGICERRWGDNFRIVDELLEQVSQEADQADLRLILTSRFDLESEPQEAWREFGNINVVLPLLELRRAGARTVLAANVKLDADRGVVSDSQSLRALEALDAAGRAAGLSPQVVRGWRCSAELPDAAERVAWKSGIGRILEEIEAGRLLKCVLARRVSYSCAGIAPLELLRAAIERHSHTFRFFVQPSADLAFLGASPERLYSRRGSAITSEALAGTRPRGASRREDEQLGRELLGSAKDGIEHESVLTHVVERLRSVCEQVEVDAGPHLSRLPDVQHLRTAVRGRLRVGLRDAEVLSVLHPTPAVCGQPTERALALLRDEEDFDRGLYGGLVGLVGSADAEVTVAIRSALVRDGRVHLFAGAGIVAGSRSEDEWEETVCKLQAMAVLLEADSARST